MTYPDGEIKKPWRANKTYTTLLPDSIERVRAFYEEKLTPIPYLQYGMGKWHVESTGTSIFYECLSPLNAEESELGCIFVDPVGTGTEIQTSWRVWSANASCYGFKNEK